MNKRALMYSLVHPISTVRMIGREYRHLRLVIGAPRHNALMMLPKFVYAHHFKKAE